jgi:hypothetical protein
MRFFYWPNCRFREGHSRAVPHTLSNIHVFPPAVAGIAAVCSHVIGRRGRTGS